MHSRPTRLNSLSFMNLSQGLVFGLALVLIAAAGVAKASQAAPGSQGKTPASSPAPRPASADRPATVLQVMRGVLYPNANVVFAAQSTDPAKVARAKDEALATDPLQSTYGGWEAVANSGIALSEATRLLQIPRACSNGKPAPIQTATWKKGIAELREAGSASYKAAQAKDMDQVLDAADKITNACATCHEVYRDKEVRCAP